MDIKKIKESRLLQLLIFTIIFFIDIVLISVNTLFLSEGIVFLILTFYIALWNASIIVYCIEIKTKVK